MEDSKVSGLSPRLRSLFLTRVPVQHPENPSRLLCIWRRFLESGIAERCVRVARRAALEEIQSCHAETHALVYGTDMVNRCTLTGSQELNRDNRSVRWKFAANRRVL